MLIMITIIISIISIIMIITGKDQQQRDHRSSGNCRGGSPRGTNEAAAPQNHNCDVLPSYNDYLLTPCVTIMKRIFIVRVWIARSTLNPRIHPSTHTNSFVQK